MNLWYCNVFNCIVICLELYLGWINDSMKTEKLKAKVGVPVPSLYGSVPIRISSLDDFGIPRTKLSF